MNSQNALFEKLSDTWNFNPISLLQDARLGDSTNLNSYLKDFALFASTNDDNSVLLTLRPFDLNENEGQREVLNCLPVAKDFQWGITITTISKSANAQYNILLPNNRNYTGLTIQNNEVEILIGHEKNIKTNISELRHKLVFTKSFTEQELEDAFSSLSNEKYNEKDDQKPEVKNLLITIPSIGPLIYNEDFEWYEGIFTSDEIAFDINVYNTTSDKLDLLLSFVDSQIQTKFYKNMLLEMEPEMIKLKNDAWREKNEITTETEAKITAEDFRKRVSIDSIIFNDDCSSQIYCHDDDIFWGHQIQISVDKEGKYVGADLVG